MNPELRALRTLQGAQFGFDNIWQPYQNHVYRGVALEIVDDCGNRHMRAVIAAHAIYSYGNIQF